MIGSMDAKVARFSKVERMIQKTLSYYKKCIMRKKGHCSLI
jgi:hypothetical protein